MLKPKHPGDYPDRDIDCQEAVSDEIVSLIEAAKNAKWSELEAAEAIAQVARGIVRGYLNNDPNE